MSDPLWMGEAVIDADARNTTTCARTIFGSGACCHKWVELVVLLQLKERIRGACSRSLACQRPLPIDGTADDLANLRIRQEQIVVDDAPALFRGVDHVQP